MRRNEQQMNYQNEFKIQFQLTKKGSQAKQAALIIESFDLLSWLNEDCKIEVISQNKIQVIIYKNNTINIELPQQFRILQCSNELLDKIKNEKKYQLQAGFKQYQKKSQNQEILIRQIMKKINQQQNSRELHRDQMQPDFNINLRMSRNQNIVRNQISNKKCLKYKKFIINKQMKQLKFFLIQRSKFCQSKKYKQTDIDLRSSIQYILVDLNYENRNLLTEFNVQLSMNRWLNQDIKINIKKQYMNEQQLKSTGREIIEQMEEQIKKQVQRQSNDFILKNMQIQLNQYMDLCLNIQLNRNIFEYLNTTNHQNIIYDRRNNINLEPAQSIAQNQFTTTNQYTTITFKYSQQMEQIKSVQLSEIQNNIFNNQFLNQQLRQSTQNAMNNLMNQIADNMFEQQRKERQNRIPFSQQIKLQWVKQRYKKVKIEITKIFKHIII